MRSKPPLQPSQLLRIRRESAEAATHLLSDGRLWPSIVPAEVDLCASAVLPLIRSAVSHTHTRRPRAKLQRSEHGKEKGREAINSRAAGVLHDVGGAIRIDHPVCTHATRAVSRDTALSDTWS